MNTEIVYWILNYFEEFLKLFLFLFFIMKVERRRELISVLILLLGGLITALLYAKLSTSITTWMSVIFLIILENTICLKKIHQFYLSVLSGLLIGVVDIIVAAILCALTEYSISTIGNDVGVLTITNGISVAILLLFSAFAYRKGKWINQILTEKNVVKYFILILSGFIAMCIYVIPLQELNAIHPESLLQKKLMLSASISAMLFIAMVLIITVNAYSKESLRSKAKLYKSLMQQQKQHYEAMLNREVETRKFRHDVTAHFNYIRSCLQKNEIEDARSYVEQLSIRINLLKKRYATGHSAVDMIVEQISAQNEEVRIQWDGTFPSSVKMDEVDICILLSNALKNAIEAAMKCESEKVKEVSILCKILGTNILLEIRNPFEENSKIQFKKGIPITDKDPYYHGFGVANMRHVVKKYGGEIYFDKKSDFITYILLKDIIC